MVRSPIQLFDAIPATSATPLAAAATFAAAAGSGLILFATAYGDWVPAVWAAGVFALAGVLWHLADYASTR